MNSHDEAMSARRSDTRASGAIPMVAGLAAISGGVVGLVLGGHLPGSAVIFAVAVFSALAGWFARGLNS